MICKRGKEIVDRVLKEEIRNLGRDMITLEDCEKKGGVDRSEGTWCWWETRGQVV